MPELSELETAFDAKLAEIREQSKTVLAEMKTAIHQEIEEKTKNGFSDPETKEKIARIETKYEQLEAQLLRAEPGNRRAPEIKSVGTMVSENAQFKDWHKSDFMNARSVHIPIGSAIKATTTTATVGSATTGVIPIERVPGVLAMPMQELRIRDLLRVQPVTTLNVDWVYQNARTNAASPQTEGVSKVESTYTWTSTSLAMKTIAHYFQVTRQALADIQWLRGEIDSELMYGLKLKEETELLSGDGLGNHISGLITNATAYDTGLTAASDTRLDTLRHAIYQARLALYPVDGIVIHPADAHTIDLIKEEAGGANKGSYVLGDPRAGAPERTLWGKRVVESDSITSGKFLVGAFGMGALLFDREQAVIDVSFEHATNFLENEATIRCEERIGLGIRRAAAFICGTFV